MTFVDDQVIVLQQIRRCHFGAIDSDGAFFNTAHIVAWVVGAKFLLKDLGNRFVPPPTFRTGMEGIHIGLDMPHAIAELVDGRRRRKVKSSSILLSSSIIVIIVMGGLWLLLLALLLMARKGRRGGDGGWWGFCSHFRLHSCRGSVLMMVCGVEVWM